MDGKFIRERITTLRMKMDVSEYKMSLDLGHSKGYMQSISSGNSLPSLSEFLSICAYLQVTPQEFFDDTMLLPQETHRLLKAIDGLSKTDLELLTEMAERLQKK